MLAEPRKLTGPIMLMFCSDLPACSQTVVF